MALTTAILYQAKPSPIKKGVIKPLKSGGYSDSGADIAYELIKHQISMVTPAASPDIDNDLDWVFPDTWEGIQNALDKGANTLWLNTVLYKDHVVEDFFDQDIHFVGQLPDAVDLYDDKFFTNALLKKHSIPVPETKLISAETLSTCSFDLGFPLVVKPLRGRGSQGVALVKDQKELEDKLNEIFANREYGNSVYIEQFLSGQEITVTVMPPGKYQFSSQEKFFDKPWCLPVVERFNHQHGIAPYSGVVAVMENSAVLDDRELSSKKILQVYEYCKKAGELLNIKAPLRIDCRADENENYLLFDLNMKPNMTGPSRPHRQNQDSLTLLAARKLGWNYIDLLKNILQQAWKVNLITLLALALNFSSKAQPNIIFILTDDQRWDAMGIAGHDIVQTPNMDQLAREGTYFTNAFVTTPICAASRASLFTGLYERTHDYTFGTPPLASRYIDISYPKLLQQAGYRTGFFGKLGVNFENRLDTAVFDEMYVTGTDGYFRLEGPGGRNHIHLTDLTTNEALDFIDQVPEGQPFSLSVSYNAAHADDPSPQQYFWPERHNNLYADITIPDPALAEDNYLHALPEFIQDENYMGRIRYKWRFDTPEKYQEKVKGYYRLITTIDDNLGRIRDKLKEKSLDQNTVIIFMSDNGYFLGERQLAGKWLMYENSIRVPLMIYDPRVQISGHVVEKIVLNIDIAPTILEVANLQIPDLMQGQSLVPLVQGKEPDWREEFICEHLFDLVYIPKSEGIRTEQWKYFRYIDRPATEELYNLHEDPLETSNFAAKPGYQEILQELREKVDQKIETLDNW